MYTFALRQDEKRWQIPLSVAKSVGWCLKKKNKKKREKKEGENWFGKSEGITRKDRGENCLVIWCSEQKATATFINNFQLMI